MATVKSSAENLTLNADGSGNDIKFQSNGVEKASIDQSGSLVLSNRMTSATGTISTAGDGNNPILQVTDTADNFVAQFEGRRDNTLPFISLYHNDSSAHASNNGFGLQYYSNNNAGTPEKIAAASIHFQNVSVTDGAEEAKIRFLTMSSGTTADRVVIEPDGDVTVETGDIVFGTAGKGICLGVTSNTDANTLDDYEEGTWTPSFNFSSSSTTVTYGNINEGHYTKIGNVVYVTMMLHVSSYSGGNGDVKIGGLPFAAGPGYTQKMTSWAFRGDYINWESDWTQICMANHGSTTDWHIVAMRDNASNENVNDTNWRSANTYYNATGHYYTSS